MQRDIPYFVRRISLATVLACLLGVLNALTTRIPLVHATNGSTLH